MARIMMSTRILILNYVRKSSFMTDENKLIRVLINLLNNAYRFTQ